MMSDPKSEIITIIRSINEACVQGKDFDKLSRLFHEDVVMVHPGFSARATGRDMCLRSYEDACSQMTFERLEGSDEQIDVYGSTAVVAYKYDCVWEFQGKKHTGDGREILVFAKDGQKWQVVWRTLIPGSRQTEVCPTEEAKAHVVISEDIRQTCLSLLTATEACYLTTIDADGHPCTTAMNNLQCARLYPSLAWLQAEQKDDFVLHLTTGMQSGKIARLRANPKASVYFCDPDQIIGFTLAGAVEIVTDQQLKNRIWQKGWTLYYPNGPEGPEYGIIRLVPRIARGWCQTGPFQFEL
jgi:general stress protein 26/ketosteroid isomerase-like protein